MEASSSREAPEPAGPWLAGGEMGHRIWSHDWSATPLGPMASWSPTLRSTVRLMLANRFPHILWWGPDYIQFYNDAYIPIPGTKHPRALGQPARECWPEIWHVIGPLIDTPFHAGPATWMEDIFLEVDRHGFLEETHFTIAYSPVPDDTAPGGIGGVLGTIHEITRQVIQERRVAALRDLGARSAQARTAEEACAAAAEALARHPEDVPFALIYLLSADGKTARLAGAAGVEPGDEAAPLAVPLDSDDAGGWTPALAAGAGHATVVYDLASRFGAVPPGPWSDPPAEALVLPIPSTIQRGPAGVLVLGISSRIALDEGYAAFAELATAQVAAAVADARAYEAERRRAEALAEIDRAKTAFFSNVSHEFRTPLTLMLGPLAEALARTDLPAPAAEELGVAQRNALRLQKLVNTLLDFSRIEAGRVQAAYEPADLAAYTAELASCFRSAVERAGLRLSVDCPPLGQPVYVDRDMWEKIVLNLLSNALKHTFEGEIAVALRPSGDHAELVVRDTGVGISAEQLPHVFERFHRVPNARSRTHEGTGIGLALVQELTRLHGGTVEVASGEGEGAAFTVRVPFGAGHLPAERVGAAREHASAAAGAAPYVEEALAWLPGTPAAAAAAAAERGAPAGTTGAHVAARGARVLVADDNADMRAYLGRLLGAHWTVELVSNGTAALDAVRARPPELVLADVMMPGLDGFGLLRELRADTATRELPVVLLSARAGEEARVEGLGAGADDYLVKPFAARELLARVGARIELARVRREAAEAVRSAQTALLRRTEQFQTLLDRAPLGVYLVDDEFRIREVNPTALPVFGDIPGLVGRDFGEVVHIIWPEPYADELVRLFRRTLETGEPYVATERIERRRDRGVTECYEWRIDRIQLPQGRYGVVCYFRDISQQVRAREAVAESQERLRQAAKLEAIGRLAGGLAHDFNNQLQALRGFAGFAARDPGIGPQARLDLAEVRKASDRMADLVRQLLAFSRQQILRPETLDLDAAVAESRRLLQRLIGRDVVFKVERGAGAKWVRADRTQLQQVLMNLSINARDAMPEGGRLQVRTALRTVGALETLPGGVGPLPAGDYVELSLADTGVGIPAEHLARIFEPFFTTKGLGHGTGLGLATVHGIVAQSGGCIWVESAPGRGTRFTVLLPLAAEPVAAAGPPVISAEHPAPRAHVLVVEDEKPVREIVARILREEGYQVIEARNGREALAGLTRHGDTIALVLTDLVMPVMGGRELVRRMAASRPDLPVVWMSGNPRDASLAADAGVRHPFLQKPVSREALLRAVRAALERSGRTGAGPEGVAAEDRLSPR